MNIASAGAIYSDILFWKFVSFGRLYDFNCSELYIFSILSYIFLEFKRTGLQTSLTIYERKLSLLIRYAWTIKFKQEFGLASASFALRGNWACLLNLLLSFDTRNSRGYYSQNPVHTSFLQKTEVPVWHDFILVLFNSNSIQVHSSVVIRLFIRFFFCIKIQAL